MNNLDKQYTDLLQDILDNGIQKTDRTGTGTISVFGRQLRHKMSEGFPLLTTKKMAFKTIVTELLWFLRGDTNIKYLVDNGCHIWDGDAYKNYVSKIEEYTSTLNVPNNISEFQEIMDSVGNQIKSSVLSKEQFIHNIKSDNEFAKKWGYLGPIYGKQWRNWDTRRLDRRNITQDRIDGITPHTLIVDQITNLINELKTNPDSRRLMVNAWNVGELDQMVLPPCHYGFQVYTRELSLEDRAQYKNKRDGIARTFAPYTHQMLDGSNIPTRAISLMWNQRSVDTPLGLPFNIASYGLLLEIIAKVVNMVPDELIGNLGDTHIYLNQIEGIKEQIGRKLTLDERIDYWFHTNKPNRDVVDNFDTMYPGQQQNYLDDVKIPTNIREPFPLPKLNINTEWWPTEGGECGIGNISVDGFIKGLNDDNFIRCLLEEDIQLSNYQSHPAIKMPLSN